LCIEDIGAGGTFGSRYLDGECDSTLGLAYYSCYSGTGTLQKILRWDTESCELMAPIQWTSADASANRMLAADPRNGGQFWCGTVTDFTAGTGRLYLVNNLGTVLQSWNSIANLPVLRWSGAAFDPDHNHLWVFIRDSTNSGNSRAFELDVSNSFAPTVIQGPHLLNETSPYSSLSSGGADYDVTSSRIVVVHQGWPSDFIQCYEDLYPDYNGPRPGPGLVPLMWCLPDSNSMQGFGLASDEEQNRIFMTDYTDDGLPQPLYSYSSPCALQALPCNPITDLTIIADSSGIRLHWTATETAFFVIYSSTNPQNDGNPDEGVNSDFVPETSVYFTPGAAEWIDTSGFSDIKYYVIQMICP
jgi:hypothetical protein